MFFEVLIPLSFNYIVVGAAFYIYMRVDYAQLFSIVVVVLGSHHKQLKGFSVMT